MTMSRLRLLLLVGLFTACTNDVKTPAYTDDPEDVRDAGADGTTANGTGTKVNPGKTSGSGTVDPKDAGTNPNESPEPVGVSCAELTCSVYATCVGGADPKCACASGLEGDGQRCEDVNECEESPCGENATCHNTFGAYFCSCNPGYVLEDDSCVPESACEDSPCDANATCSDDNGAVTCSCDEGTFGNGYYCVEQDACADEPCGENGTCITVANAEAAYVCACELGFAGTAECTACGTHLELRDAKLEAAVRRQLGLSEDDANPIALEDLRLYTSLDVSRADVKDLSGLQCWSTLQSLDLSYNDKLTSNNVGALKQLNALTQLKLDCSGVTDLSILAGHPHLRSLSANVLNCEDPALLDSLEPLKSLPQLEVLDVRGQGLTDGSAATGLRNLRELWFGYNQLESLEQLSDLPLLRELDVSFNRLEDLDGLLQFPRLQYLNLNSNRLRDLKSTTALGALKALNASGNRVKELPNWVNNRALRELDLSYNELSSVQALAALEQLTLVDVSSNAITTLAPLRDGELRGTVFVFGNPLSCETEAPVMAELRTLGLAVKGECEP